MNNSDKSRIVPISLSKMVKITFDFSKCNEYEVDTNMSDLSESAFIHVRVEQNSLAKQKVRSFLWSTEIIEIEYNSHFAYHCLTSCISIHTLHSEPGRTTIWTPSDDEK